MTFADVRIGKAFWIQGPHNTRLYIKVAAEYAVEVGYTFRWRVNLDWPVMMAYS